MKTLCALMTIGVSLAAAGADGVVKTWFDETLDKCRFSAGSNPNQWVTSVGRWDRTAEDHSVCSTAVRRIYFDTCGTEVKYRPFTAKADGTPSSTVKPSDYNTLTTVTVKDARLHAFRDGGEWECVDKNTLGGIALRLRNDGTCTFIGWLSTHDSSTILGRWLELAAAGVEAKDGATYSVKVESDYRCIPTRVRYSVNGQTLKDATGTEWFSMRNGSLDPAATVNKRMSSLSFFGRGEIGEIKAETEAVPVARGKVTIPRLKRPQAGETLTLAVAPNDGVKLETDLRYVWYLTDAAGMRVAGSERGAGDSYVLAKEDCGHWVSVDVSDANGFIGTGRFWFSNLPVVYIECQDALGYVEATDEVAADGTIYYWANEDDVFVPLDVATGTDLAPYRKQYGKLFLKDVKTAWPSSKKEDHEALIYITGNAEFKAQYESDGTLDGDKVIMSKLHVRGNSTAGQDKKPYKIKLGKKADLLNLGGGVKNKHWTLLANFFDESLMRNKLCYDYSGELGLVSMKSEWVDVVMNGKYVGNYQLCQHIRVAEERINIYDWSSAYEKIAAAAQEANPALTDDDVSEIETQLEEKQGWMTDGRFTYLGTDYQVVQKGTAGPDGKGGFTVVWKKFSTDISGGYIFELDWKKSGPSASVPTASTFLQTHQYAGSEAVRFCLAMNTPEFCFTNAGVSNYVWNCWHDIGESWTSGSGYTAKGVHYSDLCDFDSMIGYWLANFIPGNDDASGLSRYAYKDVGGKVVFGPAWDFDYGLGSLQIRTRSATVSDDYGEMFYAPIKPTGWIPAVGTQNIMGHWNWDPYFMYKLREKYWATRQYLADMVKDGGLIDRYKEKLAASARANDLRWNNRIGFFGNAEEKGDVEVLRDFLTQRFAWFDAQFAATLGEAFPNLTKSVPVSKQRYVRATDIVPTVASASRVPGSVETDLADVQTVVRAAPVRVTVAVPTANAKALDVYVNGLSNGTFAVAAKSATVEIPAAALKTGERNFLQFIAKDAAGAALANNVALLTAKLPDALDVGEGDDRAPVAVKIEWLDAAREALVKADPDLDGKYRLGSYTDYVAFAKEPSPLGKPMTLWQEFVADTDPGDTNQVFAAGIEIGADGLPRVTWTPDRSSPAGRVFRKYRLRGANDLATDPDRWDALDVSGADDAASAAFRRAHRFFTVEVMMP